MIKFTQLLLAAGLLALAGNASATLITGEIILSGQLSGFDIVTNQIDVLADTTVVIGNPTGDFSGISTGTSAFYDSFNYSSPFATVDPLWKVGDFAFTLTGVTVVTELTTFINLTGSGYISGGTDSNGVAFEQTYGDWSFTATDLQGTFSFTSITAPEPGIALLLGTGLIGFGVTRKLRKTA